jgi:Outer membrane lipoprotein
VIDPPRWTERDSDATALERDLVAAGRAQGPSADERERIWHGIAAQCAASSLAAGTDAAAAAATAPVKGGGLWAVSSWKVVAVATLVGAGAITGARMIHRGSPPISSPAAQPTPPPAAPFPSGPVVSEPNEAAEAAGESAAVPTPPPSAVRTSNDAKKVRASRLAEESRVVLDARGALRSGDLGQAMHLLEAARTEFPDGALTQEREALTIEAIGRSGRGELASKRAEAFLREYPKSPHASDVRRWLIVP